MKQRIITGIFGAALFVTLLVFGGIWFSGMIVALAVLGYLEFIRMNHMRASDAAAIVGLAGVLYFVVPWSLLLPLDAPPSPTVVWLMMFLFFAITVLSKNRTSIDNIALLFIGTVYIGFGFYYMIVTRLGENGLFWTLLLFGCIWLTDSGAYFAGRAFGRTLLWPSISPKKTVEGAIGGAVFSVALALLFAFLRPELLSVGHAIMIGLVVAAFGQMGDLIQSAYKRVRSIKDSGNLLPGHGGVLDRTDSWIIVFPIVHLLSLIPQ